MAPAPANPQPHRQHPMPPSHPGAARGGPPSAGASYYPTPAFQNHIEQLEQEYDAQANMMDESEIDTPGGPGQYPAGFNGNNNHPEPNQSVMLSPASSAPGPQYSQHHDNPPHAASSGQPYPSMTQLLDQNLDWDPFGLSASMAFPNQQQFQYDQSHMR
jgi:hypothetical protein